VGRREVQHHLAGSNDGYATALRVMAKLPPASADDGSARASLISSSI
jgi:hypothetical protein